MKALARHAPLELANARESACGKVARALHTDIAQQAHQCNNTMPEGELAAARVMAKLGASQAPEERICSGRVRRGKAPASQQRPYRGESLTCTCTGTTSLCHWGASIIQHAGAQLQARQNAWEIHQGDSME